MGIYTLVIDKNDDIKDKINQFVVKKGWKYAYISGAIGSVLDIELTTPVNKDFPPKVKTTYHEGPAEILSFVGEVMAIDKMDSDLKEIYQDDESELFIHIHASIGVLGSKVYGGGLKCGKVYRKLKVYIQEEKCNDL